MHDLDSVGSFRKVSRLGFRFHGLFTLLFVLILGWGDRAEADIEMRWEGPSVFARNQEPAQARLVLVNLGMEDYSDMEIQVGFAGEDPRTIRLARLLPQGEAALQVPLDARLRPGKYELSAELGGERVEKEIEIVPALPTERMPVLMWGTMQPDAAAEAGFTAAEQADPEDSLRVGLEALRRASYWSGIVDRHPEVDREGQRHARSAPIGHHPEVQANMTHRTARTVEAWQDYPSWRWLNVNPERRGHSDVSFDEFSREAFREFAGVDIPDEIEGKTGFNWQDLEDFPEDRILPDDDPRYVFLRWYWEGGDGWGPLMDAAQLALDQAGREDVLSFAAPALRIASVKDSWGGMRALLHWTYTHPDPTRLAWSTDALLTMARGSDPAKETISMTQLFTKRSYVVPRGRDVEVVWDVDDLPFEDFDPDGESFTITPDQVEIALWSKLAYPVDAIAYHGYDAIFDSDREGGYQFTHMGTADRLTELLQEVVQPLGPAFLKTEDPAPRVGFLQSFASEMFAGRGMYGWPFRSWPGDAYLALLHAGLQPEVLFEQSIEAGELEEMEVLVLVHCDVLTQSVADRIRQFQADGGVVVGDENLAPGIQPDFVWTTHENTRNAERRKARILEKAAEITEMLDRRFEWDFHSDNPEIVLRRRHSGDSMLLFAVNDTREAGDYIGQHGWVMEKGVPAETVIYVRGEEGTVYDLRRGQPVERVSRTGGWMRIPYEFGAGQGTAFLITPKAIDQVELDLPTTDGRGEELMFGIGVVDAEGAAVPGAIPLQVRLTDPEGIEADLSGYYATVDGSLDLKWVLAANDPSGEWTLHVRELASGKEAVGTLTIP